MALFFCIRVAGLCAVRFAKASSLLFYCWFSGVDFLADFLKIFWRGVFFLKKVVEKFGGDLESAYLCTRFRKPIGPEGPAEGLEQRSPAAGSPQGSKILLKTRRKIW